jgi:hypothetical protein
MCQLVVRHVLTFIVFLKTEYQEVKRHMLSRQAIKLYLSHLIIWNKNRMLVRLRTILPSRKIIFLMHIVPVLGDVSCNNILTWQLSLGATNNHWSAYLFECYDSDTNRPLFSVTTEAKDNVWSVMQPERWQRPKKKFPVTSDVILYCLISTAMTMTVNSVHVRM